MTVKQYTYPQAIEVTATVRHVCGNFNIVAVVYRSQATQRWTIDTFRKSLTADSLAIAVRIAKRMLACQIRAFNDIGEIA